MSIRKLKNGRWRVVCRVWKAGGEIHHKQATIEGTKAEAEALYWKFKEELRSGAGSLTPPIVSTFGEAISFYLERHAPGKSMPLFDRLAANLGSIRIVDMGDRFDKWILLIRSSRVQRTGKPVKPGTVNRYIAWAKAVLNFAVKHGMIPENPIRHIEKLEETPRDRYLTEDERLRLFNAIRKHAPHIEPFIRYSLMVPCRKGELINLPREAYNAITNTIYVPDSKAGVPIYKPVPDEMKAYFRNIPASCPYLFYRQGRDGKYYPLGDFKRAWRSCLKLAGISNCRIHDLRHCAASDLVVAGNSERVIMDIAGWKTPMLSTYWHKNSLRSAQMVRFGSNPDSVLIASKAGNG